MNLWPFHQHTLPVPCQILSVQYNCLGLGYLLLFFQPCFFFFQRFLLRFCRYNNIIYIQRAMVIAVAAAKRSTEQKDAIEVHKGIKQSVTDIPRNSRGRSRHRSHTTNRLTGPCQGWQERLEVLKGTTKLTPLCGCN